MYASQRGYGKEVQMLLDKGAQVDLQDKEGTSALMYASERGYGKVVQVLLDNGAQVDLKNSAGESALMLASREGHSEVADLLRAAAKPTEPAVCLLTATQEGRTEVVEELLDSGVDVNLQTSDGTSALISASQGENSDLAKVLLGKGAKVDLQDSDGRSALMGASGSGNVEIASMLEKNAQVNLQDNSGSSALMGACLKGHSEIAQKMIEKGAHVDLQANDGRSALMDACREGHLEVARLLLENKATIDLQSLNWESAMSLALERCLKMESALRKQLDLIASLAGDDTSRATVDVTASVSPLIANEFATEALLLDIPVSMATLALLKWTDKDGGSRKFKLIDWVSAKWKDFGIRLEYTMNNLDGWEVQYMRDFRVYWSKVMQEWLDDMGTSDYPATWKGVIVLLKDVDCSEAATKLENALAMCSKPQPPPPVFEMDGKTLAPHLSQQFVMWLKQQVSSDIKLSQIFPLKVVKL